MNPTEHKIQLAQENHDKWVKLYASESHEKLKKRLRVNHLQFAQAEKLGDEKAGELLNIMERIIIEARIYKEENNIPDKLSEIEREIADIETIVSKGEKRQEILNEFSNPVKQSRPKVQQQQDNDSQLSLF